MKKRVVLGMSGGVDSSVSAALLLRQGYEVIGVTMNTWDGTAMKEFEDRHACFGPNKEADIQKAAEVCDRLGITFHCIDMHKEFRDIVLADFSREYRQGRTPNPCVICNNRIKFGTLVDKARETGLDFDFFATGHFVRKGFSDSWSANVLMRAKEPKKDQSYFLYRLTGSQLEAAIFPLGNMTKDEVRAMASEIGLGFEKVKESQDFIDGDYSDLLDFDAVPGDIVDTEGNVLGRHEGYARYTIGQRRGLGVAAARPYYVVDIDPGNNRVIIGHKESAFGKALEAEGMNWFVDPERFRDNSAGEYFFEAQAKMRSQQQPFGVRVFPGRDQRCTVEFLDPQWAVTPGQSVVLYDGNVLLGGGIII